MIINKWSNKKWCYTGSKYDRYIANTCNHVTKDRYIANTRNHVTKNRYIAKIRNNVTKDIYVAVNFIIKQLLYLYVIT